jgi:hypothetical protein
MPVDPRLALDELHQQILKLGVQVGLGLLDQHHPQVRVLLLLGRVDNRGQEHGHVEEVVETEPVLIHLEGDELSDLRPQGADDPREDRIAKGEGALLREAAFAGHSPKPLVDAGAGIDDYRNPAQLLVGFLDEGDDLLPVFVVLGGQRR